MPNDARQLQNAGLHYASRVVLFTGIKGKNDTSTSNMYDADTIFAFRTIMQENNRIPVVCEIRNRNNIGKNKYPMLFLQFVNFVLLQHVLIFSRDETHMLYQYTSEI